MERCGTAHPAHIFDAWVVADSCSRDSCGHASPVPHVSAPAVVAPVVAGRGRRGNFLCATHSVVHVFQGLAGEPAPPMLWVWLSLAGFSAALVLVGWRGARWWVRGASVLAVPICVLAAALVVNVWAGYVLTVQGAWSAFTQAPLPNQADMATWAMAKQGEVPRQGKIVQVDTGSAGSNFHHRAEFVYLPPIWFRPNPSAACRRDVGRRDDREFRLASAWRGSRNS